MLQSKVVSMPRVYLSCKIHGLRRAADAAIPLSRKVTMNFSRFAADRIPEALSTMPAQPLCQSVSASQGGNRGGILASNSPESMFFPAIGGISTLFSPLFNSKAKFPYPPKLKRSGSSLTFWEYYRTIQIVLEEIEVDNYFMSNWPRPTFDFFVVSSTFKYLYPPAICDLEIVCALFWP